MHLLADDQHPLPDVALVVAELLDEGRLPLESRTCSFVGVDVPDDPLDLRHILLFQESKDVLEDVVILFSASVLPSLSVDPEVVFFLGHGDPAPLLEHLRLLGLRLCPRAGRHIRARHLLDQGALAGASGSNTDDTFLASIHCSSNLDCTTHRISCYLSAQSWEAGVLFFLINYLVHTV